MIKACRNWPAAFRFSPVKCLLAALALSLACSLHAQPALDAATALFEQDKLTEARVALEKLTTAEPGNAPAFQVLGRIATREQRFEDAVTALAESSELAPDNALYLARLGSACMTLAAKKRSLAYARQGRIALERALELNPDDIPSRENLLEYFAEAPGIVGGSMTKAYAHAAEIARRDPSRGFIITAKLKTDEKKYDDVFALCEARLQIAPGDYAAHYEYGRSASLSGKHLDRGIALLQKCLSLAPPPKYPSHAGVWYRLGQSYEKQGNRDAARSAYEESLKLDPNGAPTQAALAKIKAS